MSASLLHKPNAPHTLLALENAFDTVTGKPGSGRDVTKNGSNFFEKINLISEKLGTLTPPRASAAAPLATPMATVPPKLQALEKYEELPATDPGAVGEFYSKNANEILNQTHSRNTRILDEVRSAQSWNNR